MVTLALVHFICFPSSCLQYSDSQCNLSAITLVCTINIRLLVVTARTTPSKKCLSFLLWNFAFSWIYSVCLSVLKLAPAEYDTNAGVHFQIEIQKISRCGSRSPNNAELAHFKLLFCRRRQRNVQRIKTHVHSYCSAH